MGGICDDSGDLVLEMGGLIVGCVKFVGDCDSLGKMVVG
jgi:hypothetical protein